MDIFQLKSEEFSIQPVVLFHIGNFPVSSAMLSGVLLTLLILFLGIIFATKVRKNGIPTKTQSLLEMLYITLLDFVIKISGNEKVARKIMPIILAIVFYVGISNVLLTLPIIGSVTYKDNPIFTTNTKDLNSTFGIAATAVIWTHVLSIKKFNPINHILKFIKVREVVNGFKKGIGPGLMSLVDIFIGVLDIVSEFAKSLSLSLRLFGNMFAGELLMGLLLSAFAIILPVPLIFYGLFSGLLQALIFGALVTSYFGSALKED